MTNTSHIPNKHLLENQQVVEEVRRHLWIESEKAGYDIGFQAAARDWLEKFSADWMNHYMPSSPSEKTKASAPRRSAKSLKSSAPAAKTAAKKSPAKKSAKKI